MNERQLGSMKAAETKRLGRRPQGEIRLNLRLPDQHFLDAIRAEAEVRNMSTNAFMRAMIRGYFGAALHGR